MGSEILFLLLRRIIQTDEYEGNIELVNEETGKLDWFNSIRLETSFVAAYRYIDDLETDAQKLSIKFVEKMVEECIKARMPYLVKNFSVFIIRNREQFVKDGSELDLDVNKFNELCDLDTLTNNPNKKEEFAKLIRPFIFDTKEISLVELT